MNILAIDTSTSVLGVAFRNEDHFLDNSSEAGLTHAEKLLPAVGGILAEAGISPRDLDLVTCSRGPGSFTGLRIGMSTAKGVAFGAGCPLVSVPVLDAYAAVCGREDIPVVPVMDGRRKRLYAAVYVRGRKDSDDMDLSAEVMAERLRPYGRVFVTGPGAQLLSETAPEDWIFDAAPSQGAARQILLLGAERFSRTGTGDAPGDGPLYIRLSEAEEMKRKR
jgi:tRNA threonylcarbamoyladenosine biosynthesis protein TsaB